MGNSSVNRSDSSDGIYGILPCTKNQWHIYQRLPQTNRKTFPDVCSMVPFPFFPFLPLSIKLDPGDSLGWWVHVTLKTWKSDQPNVCGSNHVTLIESPGKHLVVAQNDWTPKLMGCCLVKHAFFNIFHVKIWNHPIETTICTCMFRVLGMNWDAQHHTATVTTLIATFFKLGDTQAKTDLLATVIRISKCELSKNVILDQPFFVEHSNSLAPFWTLKS